MHEMTICEQIIGQLEDERLRRGFAMVKRLRLEIGLLSCLDPDALRYAFEISTRDTFLDGVVLQIDRPPGQAKCLDCGAEVTVSSRLDICPSCGGNRLDASGGTQMRLIEMEIQGQIDLKQNAL
ncbi:MULTISPECIES: hydrogenase maturation nickel metallochaperone HypA [Rhodopseudomonas]|uniref:Hydrogenase maturation factor HypA n=1 Tax=Rhodopseudomonas palustris TaxID=1076 RepID=A0A0D7EQV3_RHOPL|nr:MULTISPECIES: hydrogenase maturation nickel metallochaperone HypA [Rhodopseudomonas]KIZ43178.1 hydrogenase nickel incorporation protein HypA [Rhodopseudomonas palustris]MDF3811855.1 hydrogenase maturation nickel metallochaperone HypA [Rhodopseudomonas sp. BAL398]WOK19747.1 hydrogenase maturation nickel metallochaperone HypA [Rhodopseudomonas sp. BAL398]